MMQHKRVIFIFVLCLLFINLIGAVASFVKLKQNEQSRIEASKLQQLQLLATASDTLNQRMNAVTSQAEKVAELFRSSHFSFLAVSGLLQKESFWLTNGVIGLGIVDARLSSQEYSGTYWLNRGNFIESSKYESDYRADIPENIWFNNIIHNSQQRWTKPYYDPSLKQFLLSYSIPIFDKYSEIPKYILVVDLDLQLIDGIVSQSLGEKYTSIVDLSGDYIYDSDSNKIIANLNLGKPDTDSDNIIDEAVYREIQAKKCIVNCKFEMRLAQSDHFVIYQYLHDAPWLVFADFDQFQLRALNRTSDNQLTMLNIGFAIGSLVCFILLVYLLFFKRKSSIRLMWQCSIMITVILVSGTVIAWHTSTNLYYLSTSQSVTNIEMLNKYLARYNSIARLKKVEPVIEIPTSVMVDSIEFLNSYNIQVTGHIMQRYPKDVPVERGVKFNEGFDVRMNQVSLVKSNTFETVIWSFQVKVRENFDYTHYPFNQGNIWLAISPWTQERNLLLVPDFAYYNGLTDINSANGIAKNLIIPGWHIRGSYFTYVNDSSRMLNSVNTYQTIDLPALAFNVIVGATFSDALITTIIPPLVIILILFVTLMTIGRRKNKFIEFKVASIIGSSSGMLFTIVFTHVSLRNKLTSAIMYIEYFYLLMYIVVLLIPVNAFLFSTRRYQFINFGNNIIIKLLFFPVISLLVFMISLWRFS